MALEIRVVSLVPGQQPPEGCHGIGVPGGILWEGDVGTFPDGYASTIMSVADYGDYRKTLIRQAANDNLKDDTVPDDPWWRQRNAAQGVCSSTEATAIADNIAATRTESNRVELAITNAATIEAVQTAAASADWPEEE
jgi:hypothetical protein